MTHKNRDATKRTIGYSAECWKDAGKMPEKSTARDDPNGRGERIRTSGLYVPNVALYQAKLHPDFGDRARLGLPATGPIVQEER